MPLISVIVPVYKVEPYLHRCVDSILNQTFTDFELILVDDGSPDNCGAICDEYAAKDGRVRVIHQKNGGLSAARNAGIDWVFANSDSSYFSFIDSDDWVHERYLELLFRASERYHVMISQCCRQETSGDTEPLPVSDKMLCVSPEEQYIHWYSAFAWGKLYQRECFHSTRYPEGILYEDVSIWYKILFSLDSIAIVDEALYYYYQRPDSIMNSNWTPAKLAQINAWEDQLRFAIHHGSKLVLQAVLKRLCWVYKHQCEEIAASNKISEHERKQYSSRLMNRIRCILLQYRSELKECGSFFEYSAWAFPKLDWLYWTAIGVRRKIKR